MYEFILILKLIVNISHLMIKINHLNISYEDANNAYEWAMSQYLPIGRFEWVKNVDKFHLNKVTKVSSKGCILEIDFEYH